MNKKISMSMKLTLLVLVLTFSSFMLTNNITDSYACHKKHKDNCDCYDDCDCYNDCDDDCDCYNDCDCYKNNRYRIQAGAFKSKRNAICRCKYLNRRNFEMEVIQCGRKLYIVQTYYKYNRKNAKRIKRKLCRIGICSFLKKRTCN